MESQKQTFKESTIFQVKINNLTNSILMFSPVIVLILSIGELNRGNLTIGGVVAFQSLTISFLTPIMSIATMINDINMVDVLLDRINDVMTEKKEKYIKNGRTSNLEGKINLKMYILNILKMESIF